MPPHRTKGGHYAVQRGRKIGIFTTWDECEAQVKGFKNARFKKFQTIHEAEIFAFGEPSSQPTASLSLQPNISVQPTVSQQTAISPESITSLQPAISPQRTPSLPRSTTLPQFTDDGPLSQYFSQYPSFIPNPNESATSEFYRMSQVVHLEPHSDEREAAHADFKDALTQEFNVMYGTDVNSLASWQALCARIGISSIPETLKECRQVVMTTHVNLVDLTTRSGTIQIFQSVKELSQYTIENGKFFPSENAHAGDLLRRLLRHILDPEMDSDRGGPRNRRGGRGARGGSGGSGSRDRGRNGRRGNCRR